MKTNVFFSRWKWKLHHSAAAYVKSRTFDCWSDTLFRITCKSSTKKSKGFGSKLKPKLKKYTKKSVKCYIKPKSSKFHIEITNISIFCHTHNVREMQTDGFSSKIEFSAEHRRQMDFNEDIHLQQKTIAATAAMVKTMPYPCHSYFLLCSVGVLWKIIDNKSAIGFVRQFYLERLVA